MLSNKLPSLLVAVFFACGVFASHAQTPTSFMEAGKKGNNGVQSLSFDSSKSGVPSNEETPSWLKDSGRLESILGGGARFKVENPTLVRTVESPVPGLKAYVVKATTFDDEKPNGEEQLYTFYIDASGRYLMVGLMVDMEKNRDVGVDIERYVRGEHADNPARALYPHEMHKIIVAGSPKNTLQPLYYVVDLGNKVGRDGLVQLMALHKSLIDSKKTVRDIYLILVSNGQNEEATAIQAYIYGHETINKTGKQKAFEYASQGKLRDFSAVNLNKDIRSKEILGSGVFKLEENSQQAYLARLSILPLVYKENKGSAQLALLPKNNEEWITLLTLK